MHKGWTVHVGMVEYSKDWQVLFQAISTKVVDTVVQEGSGPSSLSSLVHVPTLGEVLLFSSEMPPVVNYKSTINTVFVACEKGAYPTCS